MPFCTQCGQQASGSDAFCANCGARQSATQEESSSTTAGASSATAGASSGPAPPFNDPLAGLSPRTAAILCYVPAIGWIAAIIVLAARRFKDDRMIRFHAFQGLYLFAAWLIVDWVVGPIVHSTPGHFFPIDSLLQALILVVSIFMMVKASHNEAYVLPIIGELAQKSATEQ
jgi:uncharacterized membrane protein